MSGEGKLTGGGQREETERCLRTLTDVNSKCTNVGPRASVF